MFSSRLNSFLNWSVRVGRLFGIPIFLHITLLFFLWPALSGQGMDFGHSLEYAVLIVGCILLHELGHALMAKHYRMSGISITLHGFGGFAISTGYRTPRQALAISLAGPAVTFAIGILCLAIGKMGESSTVLGTEASLQFFLIHYLGSLNILLGFLNLIPSLPFDGGNSLRAILALRLGDFKAMRAVGHLGLILSGILTIYGFITNKSFLTVFGLIGFTTSLNTLVNSGGVKFGEVFADRRAAKEVQAVKLREQARSDAYLDEVKAREREREERERLRKLLG